MRSHSRSQGLGNALVIIRATGKTSRLTCLLSRALFRDDRATMLVSKSSRYNQQRNTLTLSSIKVYCASPRTMLSMHLKPQCPPTESVKVPAQATSATHQDTTKLKQHTTDLFIPSYSRFSSYLVRTLATATTGTRRPSQHNPAHLEAVCLKGLPRIRLVTPQVFRRLISLHGSYTI
jgi:hypothetical protein